MNTKFQIQDCGGLVLMVLMIAGVILPLSANAVALKVCQSGCPYSDVQVAVDAASSGDVIRIGKGIFGAVRVTDKSLRIIGEGAALTTLQQGNPVVDLVCNVEQSSPVTIANLTITNRYDNGDGTGISVHSGRGVVNSGCDVNLKDSIISGTRYASSSGSRSGGGIYNLAGSFVVKGSLIAENAANYGGGIFNEVSGDMRIMNSNITNNGAGRATLKRIGHGGGVFNNGQLVIKDSQLSGNSTDGDGGAIINNGTLTMANVLVDSNVSGIGAGLANFSAATINDSSFLNNQATATLGWNGGGAISSCGQLLLRGSIVKNNTANASYEPYPAPAMGGGIYTGCGETVIKGSQVIYNTVTATSGGTFSGGGLFTAGGAVIEVKDSIIRDNSPDDCVGGGC
jgi:hypothetical protein